MSLINVSNLSSEVLAARIVTYRILGIDKELAKIAMQELAKRRQNGDQFEYETWIQDQIFKMPKMDEKNISSVLNLISNFRK